MSPDHDERNDDGHEAVGRRSVLASAGALAAGGLVGTVRGESGDETIFDGLVHQPLGDAALSTGSGLLEVSNLDDDGDDGVAVETDGASTWTVESSETLNESMPVGSKVLTQAYDTAGRLSGAVRFTRRESSWSILAGFRSKEVAVRVDGGQDDEVDTATYYNPIRVPVYARDLELKTELIGRMGLFQMEVDSWKWDGTSTHNGGTGRKFGVTAPGTTTFKVGEELVEGETLSIETREIDDAEPLAAVHTRTVGTDGFAFGSESIVE